MYKLNKNNKIILGIIIAIIAIIVVTYVYTKEDEKGLITYEEEIQENTTKNETTQNKVETNESKKEIIVHISGQVITEGIIFLEEGDRISNAIEKAGGLKQDANISKINLAYIVEDGMKIYIPSIKEKETNSKNIQNNTNNDNTEEYIINPSKKETSKSNENKNAKKVNINTATQTELETLPGIGPSTALKIINYRTENGKFSNIEELKEVSGIGDSKFNSIKELIMV